MVSVRRTGNPPSLGLGFTDRGFQVVDPPVKIIRRAQENNRAGDLFSSAGAYRRQVERILGVAVADPPQDG